MIHKMARFLNQERQEHETVGQFHKRLAYTEVKIKEAIGITIAIIVLSVLMFLCVDAAWDNTGYYVAKEYDDGSGFHYEYKEVDNS